MYKGTGASPGIALGKALVIEHSELVIERKSIENVDIEIEKLQNALDIVKRTDIYRYNFKSEEDEVKKHIGFVIGDNYNYAEEITNKENNGADIYSLASVCLQAIKEQQETIELLQEEINKLKGEK
jgi:phosphoenolpyruvate-protein kinase (PTS system EI component)